MLPSLGPTGNTPTLKSWILAGMGFSGSIRNDTVYSMEPEPILPLKPSMDLVKSTLA